MTSLEEQFQQECDAQILPGVVLAASSANGDFRYEKAFGLQSPTEKVTINTTFRFASCTKLMTSIAALQCVDRGQIALDDDVSTVLNELKDIQILTGFNDEEPVLKKAERKITLRHLLTHTSGFGHEKISPKLKRWRKSYGVEITSKTPIMEAITAPLIFEPGTSWAYGASLDWAGVLVMRLNDISLEDYMQKNLWNPLGIKNITFHPTSKPAVDENLIHLTKREPTDGKANWTDEIYHNRNVFDDFGGGGAFGSAPEYIKVLDSMCVNDGKLLTSETVDEMFTPQLGVEPQKALSLYSVIFSDSNASKSKIPGTKLNWGLAGMVLLNDEIGVKGATLTWSGLPNLFWAIDRTRGMSTFYASNILPIGDRKSREMEEVFQKEMYARGSKI